MSYNVSSVRVRCLQWYGEESHMAYVRWVCVCEWERMCDCMKGVFEIWMRESVSRTNRASDCIYVNL